MSYLNRISAKEMADNFINMKEEINRLKERKTILTKQIKEKMDTLSLYEDDLIDYIKHYKEVIPLRGDMVMDIEDKVRATKRDQDEKIQHLSEVIEKVKSENIVPEECLKLVKGALGTNKTSKTILIIGDPNKLANKKIKQAQKIATINRKIKQNKLANKKHRT